MLESILAVLGANMGLIRGEVTVWVCMPLSVS